MSTINETMKAAGVKKFSVWHNQCFCTNRKAAKFPEDFLLVAYVEAESIEDAFRLTNHIEGPWFENDGVKVVHKSRSTSVSDIIFDQYEDKSFVVDGVGYVETKDLAFHVVSNGIEAKVEALKGAVCPGCSADESDGESHFSFMIQGESVNVCHRCKGFFTTRPIRKETFEVVVKPVFQKTPTDHATRYVDIQYRTGDKISRFHGWVDAVTREIVQVG